MRMGHPADTFSHLDMRARRYQVRVIISAALNIDDARQHFGIDVKQPCATSGAEMPSSRF